MYFTIVNPSCVATRSQSGVPCNIWRMAVHFVGKNRLRVCRLLQANRAVEVSWPLGVWLRRGFGKYPNGKDKAWCGGHAASGLCQPPTSAANRSASEGPQLPGWYSSRGVASPRIGSTIAHAASTASSLTNSVATPRIASVNKCSYGATSSDLSVATAESSHRNRNQFPPRTFYLGAHRQFKIRTKPKPQIIGL